MLLRSEIPISICAKLRTVAASNNRVHMPWSLYYCLFAPHICMALFFTHIPFVVNHTFNATPPERLQQYLPELPNFSVFFKVCRWCYFDSGQETWHQKRILTLCDIQAIYHTLPFFYWKDIIKFEWFVHTYVISITTFKLRCSLFALHYRCRCHDVDLRAVTVVQRHHGMGFDYLIFETWPI